MKFIHLNLGSLSSETDKHWRSSKTNIKKWYTYLLNYNLNEDQKILFTLSKRNRKNNKIKQINNNKTNLYQHSYTYTKYMRPTAIGPTRKYKHQYKDISLTNGM